MLASTAIAVALITACGGGGEYTSPPVTIAAASSQSAATLGTPARQTADGATAPTPTPSQTEPPPLTLAATDTPTSAIAVAIEPEPSPVLAPMDLVAAGTAPIAPPAPASTSSATTVEVTRLSEAAQRGSLPPPELSGLSVFTSRPPYVIDTLAGPKRVVLGIYGTGDDVERDHDFVAPFVNPRTQRSNALTVQTPILDGATWRYENLSDRSTPRLENSIPGDRVRFDGDKLIIGYRAGDPPSAEKCRVMVNAWQVPTRRQLTWDLAFTLGGTEPGEAWPRTKPTVTPTLLWQLKADPGFPSMGLFVDTSPEDPSRIQLTFFQRLQNQWNNDLRWVIPDLRPGLPIRVIVQAVLDDRGEADSSGQLRVWVNGRLLVDRSGRNLIQGLAEPHRWAFGVYLMSESGPASTTRITQWHRARMLTSD